MIITKNKFILWLGVVIVGGIGLTVLNAIIPFSPDEYFYANAVHAVTDSYEGLMPINSINVEHSPLVVMLASVWSLVAGSHSLFFLRYISNLFLILSLVVIYRLFRELFSDRWRVGLAFGLLTFFPILFFYGSKFLLDVPALFFMTLLIFGMVKKKNSYFISLMLLGLLLTKEYYFFLATPIISVVTIFDAWSQNNWYNRLIRIIRDLVIIFIPSLVVIVIMVDFNVGPYPRFLENSLIELFRDAFFRLNKYVLTVASDTAKVIHLDTSQNLAEAQHAAQGIAVSNQLFTSAIVRSPITEHPISFWQLLSHIYKYNFTSQEVSPVVLPLFLIGSWAVSRRLFRTWKQGYRSNRTTIIFGLFWIILVFFTFQQGANQHGFRILLPFLSVFIYTVMEAFAVLEKPNTRLVRFVFVGIAIVSLATFFYESRVTVVRSVLSSVNRSTLLFLVKDIAYLGMYLILVGLILYGSLTRNNRKRVIFLSIGALLLFLKLVPFAIEKRLALAANRDESNFKQIAQITGSEPYSFFSNINCYKVDYYLDNPMIPNYDITPHFRRFSLHIPGHCLYYTPSNLDPLVKAIANGSGDGIKRFILYVPQSSTDPIPAIIGEQSKDNTFISRSQTGWNWALIKYEK